MVVTGVSVGCGRESEWAHFTEQLQLGRDGSSLGTLSEKVGGQPHDPTDGACSGLAGPARLEGVSCRGL